MTKEVRWNRKQIRLDNSTHKNSEFICGFGGDAAENSEESQDNKNKNRFYSIIIQQ